MRLTPPGEARCPAQEATLARVFPGRDEAGLQGGGYQLTSQILGSWLPARVSGGMVLSVTPWWRLGIRAVVASCAGPGWPQSFCSLDTRCRLRGTLSSQPLAPTRQGKSSSEAAPTKEREAGLENCQPPPRSEGTAPGHAHQRPGPSWFLAGQTPKEGNRARCCLPTAEAPAKPAGGLPGGSGWIRTQASQYQGHRPPRQHRTSGWPLRWRQDTKARR